MSSIPPATASVRPRIAVVLDPRFPGGTASAVAQELPILDEIASIEIHGISTSMFKNQPVNPTLKRQLSALGHDILWDQSVISADLIILHNPSCFKFDQAIGSKFVCQAMLVVTHENFLTPFGGLGFDVEGCLGKIENASLCADRYLAPVSNYNRKTVAEWLSADSDWALSPDNWFNICDFDHIPPTEMPQDRRGRHSRPGFEKFPDFETMNLLFPAHAQSNVILGADQITTDTHMPHWTLCNFRSIPVAQFLKDIDFFVYFTHPSLRESFGRVIAEATAAGKLVITDPDTAANIGDGIIGAHPPEVNARIANFISNPKTYQDTVRRAQDTIRSYAPEMFAKMCDRIISQTILSKRQAAK